MYMAKGKPFWKSRTFWLNIVGAGAMVYNYYTGSPVPSEALASILAVLNLVLRFDTKEPVSLELPGKKSDSKKR